MYVRKLAVAAMVCSLTAACSGDPEGNNQVGTNNNTSGTNNTTGSTNNTTGATNNETSSSNNQTTSSNNDTSNTNNTNNSNNTTGTNNTVMGPMGLALAASADFATSSSAWHLADLGALTADATSFGSGDVAVAVGTDYAYVLDRSNSQVQTLDTNQTDTGIIDVSGVGSTNPHDATDAGGKVYISLYNSGEVAVATLDNGEWGQSRIDLSSYDAVDGNPELSAVEADGAFVLVVAQKLVNFVGIANSELLVIDSADDTVSSTVDLGGANAQAGLRRFGSSFAVGLTGDYGLNDGGIVAITRNAAGDYSLGETIIDEATLGGDLLDFVFVSETQGFAVVTLADFSSQLWSFEVGGAATRVESVISPGFGGLDVSADGRWLAVGERDPGTNAFLVIDLMDTLFGTQYMVESTMPPAGIAFLP